jgi:hypothetical protein
MKNGGGYMNNKKENTLLPTLKVGDEAWVLWENDICDIIHVRILDIYNKLRPISKEYHVMMDNKCHLYEINECEIFHTENIAKFHLINKYGDLIRYYQAEIKRLDKELGVER